MPLVEALVEVFLVNLVLSGDNAVVIGLAARGLPPLDRRRAVLLGGGFAVGMRVAFTLPAEWLLRVPFLRAGGGLLLIWIAYRLLTEESDSHDQMRATSVAHAIRMIILADATMSLDNILAVAAVAERAPQPYLVLAVGLLLSIPLVLAGGTAVATLMHRLPGLIWLGGAVLAYTAAELVAEDHGLEPILGDIPYLMPALGLLSAILLIATAWLRTRHRRPDPGTTGLPARPSGRSPRSDSLAD
jgi:YjbE family integral membrane protein